MTAPTFGDVDGARPVFGAGPSRIHAGCVSAWGFDCPGPGPHAPRAAVDPSTVAAFPELEPAPSLWSSTPALEPEHPARCPTRWTDAKDGSGPLFDCRLPAGHAGKHERD